MLEGDDGFISLTELNLWCHIDFFWIRRGTVLQLKSHY